MIRKLKEEDREAVLNYLYQESAYNIFQIGDIETFGFDQEFQSIFGEFNEQGEYLSVLLFYRDNMIYYAHDIRFNDEYVPLFKEYNPRFISGKEAFVELLKPYFPTHIFKPMYFCKADTLDSNITDFEKVKVLESENDFNDLYDLLSTITEFNVHKENREHFVDGKLKSINMGITTAIYQDNKIVSTVAATAETKKSAMVIAVATRKEYRGLGYASILMSHLMDLYFSQKGKELCLFYDNPSAGKIYKRLGFKDLGKWAMLQPDD